MLKKGKQSLLDITPPTKPCARLRRIFVKMQGSDDDVCPRGTLGGADVAVWQKDKQDAQGLVGGVITLVSRDSRKIIGYDTACDKSTERIQAVIDNSPKADSYHSDGYKSYQEAYYHGAEHHAHYDKSETYTVEGVNSDLRKYIPFLQRRSKCFLRSLKTAKTVLRIFVHAYNQFGEAKKKYPKLKNALHLIQFV